MSPGNRENRCRACGFPRVSGDEPPIDAAHEDMVSFSPRERG